MHVRLELAQKLARNALFHAIGSGFPLHQCGFRGIIRNNRTRFAGTSIASPGLCMRADPSTATASHREPAPDHADAPRTESNRRLADPQNETWARAADFLSRTTPSIARISAVPYNLPMDWATLETVKAYCGFTDHDATLLSELLRPLSADFPTIVHRFYEVLFQHSGTRSVFSGEAQVERLRKSLLVWLAELFTGRYDKEYLEARARIGRVHVRVGLPQEYMFAAMSIVRQELSRRILDLDMPAIPDRMVALHRLLDIELAIMNNTYREDMVARMQALERLQFEQRLRESEHLAAIGQLAASVAHEIKNPLAGISGAIQVIGAEFGSDHPHREVLDEMMRQIDRLDSAVRDLLIYARPKPPVPSRHNIAEVVDRALILFREEPAFRNVTVLREGFDRALHANVDEAQAQQVVTNILLNAAQASGPGGQIRCRIDDGSDAVRILIEDNGSGIKPELLARVFEPFFTTKARGTGLGLPICKKIVETHGGSIAIDSVVGKGTRVTIEFPHHACPDPTS